LAYLLLTSNVHFCGENAWNLLSSQCWHFSALSWVTFPMLCIPRLPETSAPFDHRPHPRPSTLFQIPHRSEIVRNLSAWLISLPVGFSNSIHAVAVTEFPAFSRLSHVPVYTYHIFFIRSVPGHLGWFCNLTVVKSVAINTEVESSDKPVSDLFGKYPGVGTYKVTPCLVFHNDVFIYIVTNSLGELHFLHVNSLFLLS
jgi:hypothetical protein